jgi:tRNA-(ms[2]io[6]A)-hydroxylase
MVQAMSEIAIEEMQHFKMVHDIMIARGMVLGREQKNDYAKHLHSFFQKTSDRTDALIQRLLIAALIEARSCERFKVFSEKLNDEELSTFYKDLMISEANHYTTFLGFARKYQDRKIVDKKWEGLLAYEAEFMKNRGKNARVHG